MTHKVLTGYFDGGCQLELLANAPQERLEPVDLVPSHILPHHKVGKHLCEVLSTRFGPIAGDRRHFPIVAVEVGPVHCVEPPVIETMPCFMNHQFSDSITWIRVDVDGVFVGQVMAPHAQFGPILVLPPALLTSDKDGPIPEEPQSPTFQECFGLDKVWDVVLQVSRGPNVLPRVCPYGTELPLEN